MLSKMVHAGKISKERVRHRKSIKGQRKGKIVKSGEGKCCGRKRADQMDKINQEKEREEMEECRDEQEGKTKRKINRGKNREQKEVEEKTKL